MALRVSTVTLHLLVQCWAGHTKPNSTSTADDTYGIATILGKPEDHWWQPLSLFWDERPHAIPRDCPEAVPHGEEQRHGCLRWPTRALRARTACPGGKRDVHAYTRDVLALPHCHSQLRLLNRSGCLVYSFGIGGDARWERWIASELQCEVHAFDPTIRLRQLHRRRASTDGRETLLELMPPSPGRVFFHYWGLGEQAAANTRVYGAINATRLLPLATILKRLGHTSIDVLKLDCEGCEWSVLAAEAESVPQAVRNGVRLLSLEMHLTDSMLPPTPVQYRRLWHNLLGPKWGHLRLQYRHDNVGEHKSPYSAGRTPSELLAFGAPSGQCCVEYVFVRQAEPHTTSNASLVAAMQNAENQDTD